MAAPIFQNKNILKASQKHAEEQFPKESVGAVVDRKYVRLTNVAADPTTDFVVAPEELLDAGEPQAIIHSHICTSKIVGPSHADISTQLGWGIPFGIQLVSAGGAGNILWWGGDAPIAPYEGRGYIFGYQDCFSIARDFFKKEFEHEIKNYPRDESNHELFLENIVSEGFDKLPHTKYLVKGDVILLHVRSTKPNHCLVYLGDGKALHHPHNQKSEIVTVWPYIDTERPFFHSAWRLKC